MFFASHWKKISFY